MQDSGDGSPWVEELRRTDIPAQPRQLADLRHELTRWAAQTLLHAEQAEGLVLASYEALANVALHAYGDDDGTLKLHARCRTDPPQVEVTVTDNGHWRATRADRSEFGGRGLVLINGMADEAEITAGEHGTTVRMVWMVETGS